MMELDLLGIQILTGHVVPVTRGFGLGSTVVFLVQQEAKVSGIELGGGRVHGCESS